MRNRVYRWWMDLRFKVGYRIGGFTSAKREKAEGCE